MVRKLYKKPCQNKKIYYYYLKVLNAITKILGGFFMGKNKSLILTTVFLSMILVVSAQAMPRLVLLEHETSTT